MNTRTSLPLVLAFALASAAALPAAAQNFTIPWYSMDGGGGAGAGGAFTLHGTVGQPDAGTAFTSPFHLTGGFWSYDDAPPESAPFLAVSRESGSGAVTIRWVRPATGYVLDWAPRLPAAPAQWAPVVPPYQTNGTHVFVTFPSPAAPGFFRLRK